MNKHVKISLIVLVAVVLLLVIAIPALADPQGTYCRVGWRFHSSSGDDYNRLVTGFQSDLSLKGHKLTDTCTGELWLGRTIADHTYYTLDEMRDYLCKTYGDPENPDPYPACNIGTPFTIGPDETGGIYSNTTYKNVELSTLDWQMVVQDNGEFEWVSVFTIE